MADVIERVTEFLSSNLILEPGESVVAAAKAMPLGQIKKNTKRQGALLAGGAIGALVAHYRETKMSADELTEKMRLGAYLVLTERRLLLIGAAGMRSLPGEFLGSVDRARIVSVDEGVTKVSFVKMLTLTFCLDDGNELAFEFPKVDAKDGERLRAALG